MVALGLQGMTSSWKCSVTTSGLGVTVVRHLFIRYDTIRDAIFYVRLKADMSQLNLLLGNNN